MQQPPAPPTQGYPPQNFGYPQGPPQPYYPPPPSYYHPPQFGYPPYYPSLSPQFSNPFPGSVFNSGGNKNESGTQTNGDVKVGNSKNKSGGVDIGSIGGNHDNHGGKQESKDVHVGNIG